MAVFWDTFTARAQVGAANLPRRSALASGPPPVASPVMTWNANQAGGDPTMMPVPPPVGCVMLWCLDVFCGVNVEEGCGVGLGGAC
jgi:hypothetical protein